MCLKSSMCGPWSFLKTLYFVLWYDVVVSCRRRSQFNSLRCLYARAMRCSLALSSQVSYAAPYILSWCMYFTMFNICSASFWHSILWHTHISTFCIQFLLLITRNNRKTHAFNLVFQIKYINKVAQWSVAWSRSLLSCRSFISLETLDEVFR